MEEEHDRHIAIYEALGSTSRIVRIYLGKPSNNEEADDEENFGEEGGRFTPPASGKISTSDGASQTPYIQNDILNYQSLLEKKRGHGNEAYHF